MLETVNPKPQGDAYPEAVSLSKGDHTVRVLLRHDSPQLLDKLKRTCLVGADGSGPFEGLGFTSTHTLQPKLGMAAQC
jgi:hypothetical protein